MNTLLEFTAKSYGKGIISKDSAIAEGPRDAQRQLKSYELLYNCLENRIWKGFRWITLNFIQGHQNDTIW